MCVLDLPSFITHTAWHRHSQSLVWELHDLMEPGKSVDLHI
jgi:hypothetical protein